VLVDHDSKNHTRVNGELLQGKTRLQAGSVIRFGRVEAKVCSPKALWDRIASA
jgi:pSer/pThr/pTyr-binding forkhead associated (FHA) protein